MLYSLAIEPLLNKLRREISGVCFLGCTSALKLSTYADDVVIILTKLSVIHILEENVIFHKISPATINWKKSEAVLTGKKDFKHLDSMRRAHLEEIWTEVIGGVLGGGIHARKKKLGENRGQA